MPVSVRFGWTSHEIVRFDPDRRPGGFEIPKNLPPEVSL
jgi:hypothetical protein